jgi:hypothetical protein
VSRYGTRALVKRYAKKLYGTISGDKFTFSSQYESVGRVIVKLDAIMPDSKSKTRLSQKRRLAGLSAIVALAMLGLVGISFAGGESVLYSFKGGSDGGAPYAGLVLDSSGVLYGTTLSGGDAACATSGCGTVFELTPPNPPDGAWTETVVHAFTGGSDGQFPFGGLLQGANGVLYGTTEGDGVATFGTVFELTPPLAPGGTWSETVLYSFTGGMDGGAPLGGLIADASGALYGTTALPGTAFSLTPPAVSGGAWTETVLFPFSLGVDGSDPQGGLLLDAVSGALCGTTSGGGSFGAGAVFELMPPTGSIKTWPETLMHSFSSSSRAGDGFNPTAGLLVGPNGTYYGTTASGGFPPSSGTVFALTPPSHTGGAWSESILYSFSDPNNGSHPHSALVSDALGTLYGTTLNGGSTSSNGGSGDGVVFSLTPPLGFGSWTEMVLHSFTGNPDGSMPWSGLVMDGNSVRGCRKFRVCEPYKEA